MTDTPDITSGFKNEIKMHAKSDMRLECLFHLDEGWKQMIMESILDMIQLQHSVQPADVHFDIFEDEDGEDEFWYYIDCETTDVNESVFKNLLMVVINTDTINSDTLSDREVISQMMIDSGCEVSAIEEVCGPQDSWMTEQIQASNYTHPTPEVES